MLLGLPTTAAYAGSFDPLTDGHVWVIDQGLVLFDRLIVLVADNYAKRCLFSATERAALIERRFPDYRRGGRLQVEILSGEYTARYARELGAYYLLRGIRNASEVPYEQAMARVNDTIGLPTLWLPAPEGLEMVSSSLVKSLIGPAGWPDVVKHYVPAVVLEALQEKFHDNTRTV